MKSGSEVSQNVVYLEKRPKSIVWRVGMSVGLLAAAASVVGAGAYASFTDTQSVSQTVSTGTLFLNGVGTNAANNRLSIGASNIAPADTIDRAVDIIDGGTVDVASVALTTSATTSSLLDTDGTNGLQMRIDKCSVAWTESGGPIFTYTCGGTTSSVLASTPVVGSNFALSNLTLTAGTHNYLKVRLTLPSTAGNTFQGLSSTINYSFVASQRAGQAG